MSLPVRLSSCRQANDAMQTPRDKLYLGVCKIQVVGARNLMVKDSKGERHVHVSLMVSGNKKAAVRTKSVKDQNYTWNETFTLDITDGGGQVEVAIWSSGGAGGGKILHREDDFFLGSVQIDLGIQDLQGNDWYTLQPRLGNKTDIKRMQNAGRADYGQLRLEWEYEYNQVADVLLRALRVEDPSKRWDPNMDLEAVDTQVKNITGNIGRIIDYIDCVEQPVKLAKQLILWEFPSQSLLALLIFILINYFNLLLPAIPALVLWLVIRNYFIRMKCGPNGVYWKLVEIENPLEANRMLLVNKLKLTNFKMLKFTRTTNELIERLDVVSDLLTWKKMSNTSRLIKGLILLVVYLTLLPLPPPRPLIFVAGILLFSLVPIVYYFPTIFKRATLKELTGSITWLAWLQQRASAGPKPLKAPTAPVSNSTAPTQIRYTAGLCLDTDALDLDVMRQYAHVLKRRGGPLDIQTTIELLLYILQRLRDISRSFVVPEAVEHDAARSAVHSQLDFAARVRMKEYGNVPPLGERKKSTEKALLEGSETLVPMVVPQSQSLNVGFLINAAFQDNGVLFYYTKDRMSVYFRVYGTAKQPIQLFQPAMCASQTPYNIRSLIVSCCQPTVADRPSWKHSVTVLGQELRQLSPQRHTLNDSWRLESEDKLKKDTADTGSSSRGAGTPGSPSHHKSFDANSGPDRSLSDGELSPTQSSSDCSEDGPQEKRSRKSKGKFKLPKAMHMFQKKSASV